MLYDLLLQATASLDGDDLKRKLFRPDTECVRTFGRLLYEYIEPKLARSLLRTYLRRLDDQSFIAAERQHPYTGKGTKNLDEMITSSVRQAVFSTYPTLYEDAQISAERLECIARTAYIELAELEDQIFVQLIRVSNQTIHEVTLNDLNTISRVWANKVPRPITCLVHRTLLPKILTTSTVEFVDVCGKKALTMSGEIGKFTSGVLSGIMLASTPDTGCTDVLEKDEILLLPHPAELGIWLENIPLFSAPFIWQLETGSRITESIGAHIYNNKTFRYRVTDA